MSINVEPLPVPTTHGKDRVPLLVLVSEITERAVSIDGRVQSRRVLPISVTVDHRYVDAAGLGRVRTALEDYLRCPSSYESEPM